MLDQVKYFDGELDYIEASRKTCARNTPPRSASSIHTSSTPPRAARNGSTNHSRSTSSSPRADIKTLSHMYRDAWRKGLKTTYYLRTLGASNIEKATTSVKKEVRGRARPIAHSSEKGVHRSRSQSLLPRSHDERRRVRSLSVERIKIR